MEKQKVCILVVDDDETILESCSRVLREEGYEVETALSGQEALQKLKKNQYDLVLIDIRMPGMDGIETLEEMKKEVPDITVVMFTEYPSIETARESMRLETFDYLPKPFTPEELLSVVKKSIEKEMKARQKRESEERLQKKKFIEFTASSIMRSKLIICDPNINLMEVAKKMIYENVRSILIKQDEKIVGIIVDKNILNIIAEGKDFKEIRAADIMSFPLECCDAEDSLEKCMELFEKT
ncbi:response regulator, partial [bacterium]|nr:response regulator [bacterium]